MEQLIAQYLQKLAVVAGSLFIGYIVGYLHGQLRRTKRTPKNYTWQTP